MLPPTVVVTVPDVPPVALGTLSGPPTVPAPVVPVASPETPAEASPNESALAVPAPVADPVVPASGGGGGVGGDAVVVSPPTPVLVPICA